MSNHQNHRRDADHQRRVLETRRSNAAVPHKNKAKYDRKRENREWKRDA